MANLEYWCKESKAVVRELRDLTRCKDENLSWEVWCDWWLPSEGYADKGLIFLVSKNVSDDEAYSLGNYGVWRGRGFMLSKDAQEGLSDDQLIEFIETTINEIESCTNF
jgi:hypothetical protein